LSSASIESIAAGATGSSASARATLGQRVYATRRRANLTIAETAQAAGVSEDDVARAEAEEPVAPAAIDSIEALLKQID
jgi:transcriptional regulator with XRE-family HTH domain